MQQPPLEICKSSTFPILGLEHEATTPAPFPSQSLFPSQFWCANLTVEELQAMFGNLSSEHLMKQLQRYAAKVQGSNQYRFQRHQELRALLNQKGPPIFFWTVSSADTYWPELHNLVMHPPGTQPTHRMRVQAVINNLHITDWYFSSKLSEWIDRPLAIQDT